MDFSIFYSSFLALIVIFYAKYVESYPQLTDCSTIVTSNHIRFLGCKQRVRTDSLSKPKTRKKTIYTFRGIPFAEPPVGPLRFRKPLTKVLKKGTLIDSRSYKKPCMQPWIVDHPFGVMSEDCLYLNIWTPSISTASKLPVMIWIYGGAFTIGSGSQLAALYLSSDTIYSGQQLALRDVVVITINYRLGVLGFLYGNTSDCPGNQGLWDQIMAFNWVKDNVKAFGGNPNDITLFGESAGSISISNHIVSNFTRHLFKRAIMQSGSAYIKLFSRDKKYSYEVARRFASNDRIFRSGSCAKDEDWIECLRNKSATELLYAHFSSIIYNPSKPWYTVYIQHFTPIFGDELVPISINKAVKDGNFKKDIKILMGHNEMEGALFTQAFDLLRGLYGRYIPIVPIAPVISKAIVFNDIRDVFFDNDTIGIVIAEKFTETFHDEINRLDMNAIRRAAIHAFGDYFLTCPTVLFGGHMVDTQDFTGEIYQYRLTYAHTHSHSRLSIWADVTHTDDLALVFGNPFSDYKLWSNADRRLSREIMNIWTHFAKHDKIPKVNGNVWPTYGLTADYRVNASYLELHASSDRLGKIWTNRYNLNPRENPQLIGDCFYFWDEILSGQFEPQTEKAKDYKDPGHSPPKAMK